MENATSIAVVVASAAVVVVAELLMVVLGYLIFILKNVFDVTNRVKKSAKELSAELKKAFSQALRVVPRLMRSRRSRSKRD